MDPGGGGPYAELPQPGHLRLGGAGGVHRPHPETEILRAEDGDGLLLLDGGATVSTAAVLLFTGSDDFGVAGFRCTLDGAASSPCDTPQNLVGLTIGVHTFEVSAVDTSGNVDPTPATLSWEVLAPSDGVRRLAEEVTDLGLPKGVETRLLSSLEVATERLADGNPANDRAACNTLESFVVKVESELTKGTIAPEDGARLVNSVEAIRAAADC